MNLDEKEEQNWRPGHLMDKKTGDEKKTTGKVNKMRDNHYRFQTLYSENVLNRSLFKVFPHLTFNFSDLKFGVPVLTTSIQVFSQFKRS